MKLFNLINIYRGHKHTKNDKKEEETDFKFKVRRNF